MNLLPPIVVIVTVETPPAGGDILKVEVPSAPILQTCILNVPGPVGGEGLGGTCWRWRSWWDILMRYAAVNCRTTMHPIMITKIGRAHV